MIVARLHSLPSREVLSELQHSQPVAPSRLSLQAVLFPGRVQQANQSLSTAHVQREVNASRASSPITFHCFAFRQSKKLDETGETVENDEEEVVTKMMSSQMYLTPLDVLKNLEKIWANEKEVLTVYLATLRPAHQSNTSVYNDPISLFFFEVLPVLPSKFRPVS